MKKTLLVIASILSIGFGALSVLSNPVLATSETSASGTSSSSGSASSGGDSETKKQIKKGIVEVGGKDASVKTDDLIKNIIKTMFFIVGVLSVVMIIYGGIQFVLSVGNSTKVTNARNTILYAVVGLVVSIMAYAIVNFVVKAF